MQYMLVSREWFQTLKNTAPDGLTDVQRAARFFYLQKNAFGGRVFRRNFASHVVQPPRFTLEAIRELIPAVHQRLSGVQIENSPYMRVLDIFDRADTFFYLDPPYFGKQLYNHNLTNAEFSELSARLKILKGKFMLSLNDLPEVREIFRHFELQEITLAYSAQRSAGRRFPELIIKNF